MERRSLVRRLVAATALTLTAVVGGTSPSASAEGPVLSINEIDYDQDSTDTAEFVEIVNVGDATADLSSASLVFVNGANGGAAEYDTIALTGTLAAGDHYVVCANAATVANCDLDDGPDTNFIQNGDPDAIALLVAGVIVDTVSYGGDVPGYTEGSGSGLDDDATAGTVSLSRCADGADTDQNNVDFVLTASTPGTANDCETDPDPEPVLVINEIDYDQASTDTAEFVEIVNVGDAAADLATASLVFVNGVNGGAAEYDTIALSGSLAAGDHYVVCANAATVANCDLDDGPDTNFIQNGDPDAIALLVDGVIVDTVSYEGAVPGYTEGSGGAPADTVDGSIARCPDGADTDQNDVDFVLTTPTPGEPTAQDCAPDPEPQDVLISQIQGTGPTVAISGLVTVEAIVVADFQGSDQLRGFFLQEEDADADADPMSSEGIFVYCNTCPVDVSVGDLVEVTGLANDFQQMSQITATFDTDVSVVSSGNALPTPAAIDLPASGSTRAETTLEAMEGMLVTFTDTMVVSEYFELARFGHLVLNAETRARQFTDLDEPSVAGYAAYLDELNKSRIYLDDDNNFQNDALGATLAEDEPYYWPRPGLSTGTLVRGGDSIDGLTGVLHWSWPGNGANTWRVRPVEEAFDYTFTSENPRPEAPEDVGGSLKVASFNVLNYFTTIDSRGADSTAELDRQRAKIADAICAMDADVVGLVEIENNGAVAISDLLDGAGGVNAGCGEYAFVDTGVIGTDAIAVAFIYRPDTVSPNGAFAVLDSSVDPRFDDDRNRPALAQTFTETATGEDVTVVVNHLKSKGSACTPDDPDLLDGQGNCNVTRTEAAAAMVDWLAGDPTGAGTDNVLIIGDLNAYRNEDPIDAIEAGADDTAGTDDDYVDLLDSLVGASAYTYVFDGQIGYLDHALAGVALADKVTGATVWHVNADEIPVLDYNDGVRDPGEAAFERESTALPIYEPDAFRSSDHDPVIVGLDLAANEAPVCAAATASVPSLWAPNHRLVLIEILGVTDPDGDAVTITIDGIAQDEAVDAAGSGATQPDASGVGAGAALVRAERSGRGDGRVYHISFTATDGAGGSCSGTVQVEVPRSGNGRPAVDGGALFDSTIAP